MSLEKETKELRAELALVVRALLIIRKALVIGGLTQEAEQELDELLENL